MQDVSCFGLLLEFMEPTLRIDIDAILKAKAPNASVPRFLVSYLKRIVHQEEINAFLASEPGTGFDFIDATLKFLRVDAVVDGLEHLPDSREPVVFVSNHPLGGLDGMVLALMIGKHYTTDLKVLVNDLLMYLSPLSGLFVPVNKTGAQTKSYAKSMRDVYESGSSVLTFPAGACSRKLHGVIQDLEWRKNFVVKAVEYRRQVVPVYFEGRNSRFFYNLARVRKFLGIKLNVEMLYLADEMFRQRGSCYRVRVGEPVSWQMFDRSRTPVQWAQWMRDEVYKMR